MSKYESNQETNSTRFFNLADKLNKTTEYFQDNLYVLCNSNIQLQRNHPKYLQVWHPVIYKGSLSFKDLINISYTLVYSIYRFIIDLLSEILSRAKKSNQYYPDSEIIDYIFISHLIDRPQNSSDFYYGDFLDSLVQAKKTVLRLLIPHVNHKNHILIMERYPSLILAKKMKFTDLVKYAFFNLHTCLKIIYYCVKHGFTYFELITILCGQFRTLQNYKISKNLECILSRLQVKNLIMTFEGNAIEKCVFYICTKYNIVSMGYQHAPLIKDQYAIFQTRLRKLDPNVILCSGKYTFYKFKEKIPSEIPVHVIGSYKFYDNSENKSMNKISKSILLIPDGNSESIEKFLRLGVFLASRGNQKGIVSIRSHPIFNEYIKAKFNGIAALNQDNFFLSHNSLIDDLENSEWVIYENSAVSIQALFYYCKVIYFENCFANVDPLWELSQNHFIARSFQHVEEILSQHNHINTLDQFVSLEFANNYFSKPNLRIFN